MNGWMAGFRRWTFPSISSRQRQPGRSGKHPIWAVILTKTTRAITGGKPKRRKRRSPAFHARTVTGHGRLWEEESSKTVKINAHFMERSSDPLWAREASPREKILPGKKKNRRAVSRRRRLNWMAAGPRIGHYPPPSENNEWTGPLFFTTLFQKEKWNISFLNSRRIHVLRIHRHRHRHSYSCNRIIILAGLFSRKEKGCNVRS